jgi:hypothetical protein
MFTLYEGSLKEGTTGDTALEVFESITDARLFDERDEDGGYVSFYDRDAWREWWDDKYSEDDRGQVDDELSDTGMPRILDENQVIIEIDTQACRGSFRLFNGAPSLDDFNSALADAYPDYGYRIVEE